MKRCLVVFYSRTGTTRTVAESLSAMLHCPIEEIADTGNRRGILGYLRSGWEATRRITPRIIVGMHDPAAFDCVVVGTPVWVGSVSSPVRSYLSRHRGHFSEVAFFCTEGARGGPDAFQQMEALCGKEPVATLELREDQVRHQRYHASLERFGDRVGSMNAVPVG